MLEWHHSLGGFRRYGLSVKRGEGESKKEKKRRGKEGRRHEEGN